ncbi:hypothetical protein [Tahibacter amnicola]|uniref:Uncharacterized protein n=1 Tax=Tahibacter amnicola TaxID=2976241 RepID=A0ABY6BJU0_9GAMM|nr:hypothetical protein [Tahibacter amnicola]UXI70154.1 hypothetical protein N4264_11140 [Tahibacter amnicola]
MGVYLEQFPGALEPRRTPFDEPGEPVVPCAFIYLTNRYEGRWSYLMPVGFEKVHDPIDHVAMGYTQLWIMQKMQGIHPGGGSSRSRASKPIPAFDEGIERSDYVDLFHILREPGAGAMQHNDHLGGRRRYRDAVETARQHAQREHCRVVVAKLLHDWTWH